MNFIFPIYNVKQRRMFFEHPVMRWFLFLSLPWAHTHTHTKLCSCSSKLPAPGISRPSPISNTPPLHPIKLVVQPFTFPSPSFHLPGLSHFMIIEVGSQEQDSNFIISSFKNNTDYSLSFSNFQRNHRKKLRKNLILYHMYET